MREENLTWQATVKQRATSRHKNMAFDEKTIKIIRD